MSWKSFQLIKLRPRKGEMNGREGEDALGDGAGVGPRDSGYSVTLQMNGSSSNPLAFVLVHFLYNYSLPE